MRLLTIFLLSVLISFVSGHARIKVPKPLDAPPDDATGNAYNAPLAPDGSEFPCRGLHMKPGVDKTPTQTWAAGSMGMFEILGHNVPSGEGSLAAHSGGSCQASLSYDNGATWKVLQSYHGGCPRDVELNSNMAGPNQTFTFQIPAEAKAGICLFAWNWIAVTGNRDEYYMNCASVTITGSGESTLDDYPDMFVGDMNLPGQIATGECRSTAGNSLVFPDPGPSSRVTETSDPQIPFKGPSPGKCYAPRKQQQSQSSDTFVVPTSVSPTTMATVSRPAQPTTTILVDDTTTYPAYQSSNTYPVEDTSYPTYKPTETYPADEPTNYPTYQPTDTYPVDEPTSYPIDEPTYTYPVDEPTSYPAYHSGKPHRSSMAHFTDDPDSYPAYSPTDAYPTVEPTSYPADKPTGTYPVDEPFSYPAYQATDSYNPPTVDTTSYPAPEPTYSASEMTYPDSEPTYPASEPTYPASEPTYHASEPTYSASEPTYPASEPTYPVSSYTNYPVVENSSNMYPGSEPTTFSFVHGTRTYSDSVATTATAVSKMYPGASSMNYSVVDPAISSPTSAVYYTNEPASADPTSTYCPPETSVY